MTSTWPGLTVSERRITMGEVMAAQLDYYAYAYYAFMLMLIMLIICFHIIISIIITNIGDGCPVGRPSSRNVRSWHCCRGGYFFSICLFFLSIYLVIGWDICSIRVIMIGWVLKCVQLSNSMRIFILFVVWSC